MRHQNRQVPHHLLEEPLSSGRSQVADLLRAQHEAESGRSRTGEEPHHLLHRNRRELVDHDERRHRPALQCGNRGLQVLDDGRA